MVKKNCMHCSEQQGEDCPFQRLKYYCPHIVFFAILEKVLDQFAVMECKEEQPSNRKDDEEEEKVYHEYIGYFVAEIEAEEIFALWEEVECELLNIALVDYEQKNSIECVFADVLGYSVVEESLEKHQEDKVSAYHHGKLVEEEFEVIGEETHPILIFREKLRFGIIPLLVQKFSQSIERITYWITHRWVTVVNQILRKRTSLQSYLVGIGKKDVGVVGEILFVEEVELKSIESWEEVGERVGEYSVSRQFVHSSGCILKQRVGQVRNGPQDCTEGKRDKLLKFDLSHIHSIVIRARFIVDYIQDVDPSMKINNNFCKVVNVISICNGHISNQSRVNYNSKDLSNWGYQRWHPEKR